MVKKQCLLKIYNQNLQLRQLLVFEAGKYVSSMYYKVLYSRSKSELGVLHITLHIYLLLFL